MFLFLGCALPQYNNWWPMFVLLFYILSPIPMSIAKHYQDSTETSALVEIAIFLTTGIVVSAFGLPIILAHSPIAAPIIQWGACAFILAGNTIVFFTILAYFYLFCEDGFNYNGW
ncbi:Leptin receptor overlapping transcript-like 1 [Lamellibrachia satsuma]|nr:Leptin receptor overlapping transcript-like 1 [Lamellibrachia satsuma]